MSELDDKLREILAKMHHMSILQANSDVRWRDWALPRIRTAFEEEGYVHVPQVEIVTKHERGKKPELLMVNGKEVMTGPEWYRKFADELANTSIVSIPTKSKILKLAKRASNGEE